MGNLIYTRQYNYIWLQKICLRSLKRTNQMMRKNLRSKPSTSKELTTNAKEMQLVTMSKKTITISKMRSRDHKKILTPVMVKDNMTECLVLAKTLSTNMRKKVVAVVKETGVKP